MSCCHKSEIFDTLIKGCCDRAESKTAKKRNESTVKTHTVSVNCNYAVMSWSSPFPLDSVRCVPSLIDGNIENVFLPGEMTLNISIIRYNTSFIIIINMLTHKQLKWNCRQTTKCTVAIHICVCSYYVPYINTT